MSKVGERISGRILGHRRTILLGVRSTIQHLNVLSCEISEWNGEIINLVCKASSISLL